MNYEIPNQLRNKFVGLDIYLAKHCNLKCRGCTRFCNIAKPEFYNTEQLMTDLLTMLSNGINIGRLTLTGGEPLIHPELISIIKDIRSLNNRINLNIFTNGKLFMKLADDLIPVLKRYNVDVLFTRYNDPSIDYDSITKICEENDIKVSDIHKTVFGYDCTIQKFTCNRLSRPLNNSKSVVQKYNYCSDTCPCLWDSKIYLCGKCAFADSMNDYVHTNFKETTRDYIRVEDLKSTEQYLSYISKPIPFCKYCFNTPGKDIPWSTSRPEVTDFIV